jgi:ssDNA-binding Zn-finger/Zn-ribbon topoisomerase 1
MIPDDTQKLSIIKEKCPLCGAGLDYIQGDPDFFSCPNRKICGFRPYPVKAAIMLMRKHISSLEHQLKEINNR